MDNRNSALQQDEPFLRPLRLGDHVFPGIWASMFPAELQELRFPAESRATCQNCPKVCHEAYRPDYRCCTYQPRVANFLLGFANLTPKGQGALDQVLRQGMILPEGMLPSPRQWLNFMEDQAADNFGRSLKVLCPMLDQSNGLCQIHPFRNAVCSTYFCYHDQGEAGELFWGQIQTLGSQLEIALGQWALEQLGFDLDQYFSTLNHLAARVATVSTAEGWQKEVLASLWGSWYGKEKALFDACAALLGEHRQELWQIAKNRPIQEARLFERAVDGLLPFAADEYDEEKQADDHPEIYELAETTWQRCLAAYKDLYEQ